MARRVLAWLTLTLTRTRTLTLTLTLTRTLTLTCLVASVACDRDKTTSTIHAPVDPPTSTTASVSAPRPVPVPRKPPPDFAMVAVSEGDPFVGAVPPAGATLEKDAVATTRFVRWSVPAGSSTREGCNALMKWAATVARLKTGVAMVCGEDRHALPAHAVRTWVIEPTPLLSRIDVVRAEVRYDENVDPLHGHVVCELLPASVTRWNAWAKTHPKVRIALQLGPDVIDVDDVGPAAMTGGELWLTPKRTYDALASNAEATVALAAAMSGDAGAP